MSAGLVVFLAAFHLRAQDAATPPAPAESAAPADRAQAGGVLTNSIGMKLAKIPAGEFLMGSKDEFGRWGHEHQHPVRITKGFYIGVFEVTQAEFENVMGHNPSQFAAGGKKAEKVEGLDTTRFPADSVSWSEAVEFARKLSERPEEKAERRTYRLPTEAEWEYACRAGTATPFHFGEALSSEMANFDGNTPYLKKEDVLKGVDPSTLRGPYLERPTTAGSYPPNAWGLHDMHGNVWEWCSDWYSPVYFKDSPLEDPQGPESGTKKVSRGGGWYYFAAGCRSASRYDREPGEKRDTDGFRVVCVVTEE